MHTEHKNIFKTLTNKVSALLKSKFFWVILLILLFSGVTHGYNMFHYPYYENDEGVYMSQAWSLIKFGKMAPYTYWYDHAPAGWIFIAIWVKLTGGFFTFGTSVNSGRVLMMILHVLSSALLLYISKKTTKGYLAGIIAVIVFSLTPLGIYFQRRVLLDSIMIFWVLLSLAYLYKDRFTLSNVVVSAVLFGIGVLSKENAIFFIPGFLYLIYLRSHADHKRIVLLKWIVIVGSVVILYFLYAWLKGELFPTGFLSDKSQHVSLLETLKLQYGRGKGYSFWDTRSDFYQNLSEWITKDPFIIIGGFIASVLTMLVSLRNKHLRTISLLVLFFIIFLVRGKTVINFYIVPLIPIFALCMGILVDSFSKTFSFGYKFIQRTFSLTFLVLAFVPAFFGTTVQYTKNETAPQIEAINWIKGNLDPETKIAIDDYGYVDLHDARFKGDPIFPNADWFWKLETDPEIRNNKYQNDWKNVTYIALSHEMLRQTKHDNTQNFLNSAFDNSQLVKEWKEGSTSYFDLRNYISTNGDWMSIYKLRSQEDLAIDTSWIYFKNNFIKSYGQIIDPQAKHTTSEGQSYAMLKAVWLNDQSTFDGVWSWTKDHLQYRGSDKLFSWLWEGDDKTGHVVDSGTATDADEDIALALLFAYKSWGNVSYLNSAKEIIADIWKNEVVTIDNKYYLLSSASSKRDDGYLLNPSYFSPASYRIFNIVDQSHNWNKLADDSYSLLEQMDLPSNWILIKNNGQIDSAAKYVSDPDIDSFGFDAFRTMWRVALDLKWFNSESANRYLSRQSNFFESEWRSNNRVFSIYDREKLPKVSYESISTSVGALSVLVSQDTEYASKMYKEKFVNKFDFDKGYWNDGSNYYDQNWAWFGTALYSNRLVNLFEL